MQKHPIKILIGHTHIEFVLLFSTTEFVLVHRKSEEVVMEGIVGKNTLIKSSPSILLFSDEIQEEVKSIMQSELHTND